MQLTLSERIKLAESIRNERAKEMLREADRKLAQEIVSFECRCKSCIAKRAWYAFNLRTVECQRREKRNLIAWAVFEVAAVVFAVWAILKH